MVTTSVKLDSEAVIDIPLKSIKSLPFTVLKRSLRLIFAIAVPIVLLPLITYNTSVCEIFFIQDLFIYLFNYLFQLFINFY